MHNFTANYEKILEVLKELELDSENFLYQIRKPKLTDLRIIAINLTSEYMSIDSEHQLFRILPSEIKLLIERSVYNRREKGYLPIWNALENYWQKNLMVLKSILL